MIKVKRILKAESRHSAEEIERYNDWLRSSPACIQELEKEFPPGLIFEMESGERLYLLGYTEEDLLIVSPVCPFTNFDEAMENKRYLCPDHVRRK